jgi:phosphoglycerate dehydrogenase-like enzyme
LLDGGIAGPGLDVYAEEPTVRMRLMALDNVVLLTHLSAAPSRTLAAIEQLILDNHDRWPAQGIVFTPAPVGVVMTIDSGYPVPRRENGQDAPRSGARATRV